MAVTKSGSLLTFAGEAVIEDIAPRTGATFASIVSRNLETVVVGGGGRYYINLSGGDFELLTHQYIVPQPVWGASRAEKRAYFAAQTHIMNADVAPDGRVAMTEFGKVMVLEPDLSMTEILQPRIMVGVTFDPATQQFWFCGHSPRPIVAREVRQGQLETVYQGLPNTHVFTDIAVHEGEVYLADTDLNAGGLFVLSPENDGDFEFNRADIPPEFGNLPVWKLHSRDGILWVLRTKDLLRLSDGAWEQYPIPDIEMPLP